MRTDGCTTDGKTDRETHVKTLYPATSVWRGTKRVNTKKLNMLSNVINADLRDWVDSKV